MKTTYLKKQMQVIMSAAVALLAAGCATPTTQLPPQAVTGLVEVRSNLIMDRAQIEQTTSAAKEMVDRPVLNVQSQISAFDSALAKLKTQMQQTREAAAAADAVATDYFATWGQKLQGISGEMAQAGQQRRQASMASWKKMQDTANSMWGQYASFMHNLDQVDKYLQTDSTADGVKAATPTIQSALAGQSEMINKINDLIAQIDIVRSGH